MVSAASIKLFRYMFSSVLGILLVGITFGLLKFLKGPKYIYLLHFLLLLTTPWLVILILGKPSFNYSIPNKIVCNQNSSNSSCLLSLEFLFFQADSRPHYGIKDFGVFLPSFIPAISVAIWIAVTSRNKRYLLIPLVAGLILTTFSSKDYGLISALWLVTPMSALSTLGFYEMLIFYKRSGIGFPVRIFILANFVWLTYETARMYQVILFHKPFF